MLQNGLRCALCVLYACLEVHVVEVLLESGNLVRIPLRLLDLLLEFLRALQEDLAEGVSLDDCAEHSVRQLVVLELLKRPNKADQSNKYNRHSVSKEVVLARIGNGDKGSHGCSGSCTAVGHAGVAFDGAGSGPKGVVCLRN